MTLVIGRSFVMKKLWHVRYDEKMQKICILNSRKEVISSVEGEDADAVPASILVEISQKLGLDSEVDEKILSQIEWEIYTTYYDR